MANRRYNLNNSSRPSSGSTGASTGGTPPSPAPAAGSTGATKKQNAGAPGPGVLLGLSGGWLVTRMIFLGGVLLPLEIIAIIIAAGFVYPKGGKVQKRFATAIIVVALLNLFVPGINPGVKQIRETQLNTTEEMSPIVIDKDGVYELPNRPLKVCFTKTGDPAKDFYIDQQIKIDDWKSSMQRLSGCLNIPTYLNGKKVNISLNSAGKQYTTEIKNKWGLGNDINNDYEYYKSIGMSDYPTIQSR